MQVEEPNSSSCHLEATNTCPRGLAAAIWFQNVSKVMANSKQFENLAHMFLHKHMLSVPLLVVCIVLRRAIKRARENQGGPCDHSPAQHKQTALRATKKLLLAFQKVPKARYWPIGPGIGATS